LIVSIICRGYILALLVGRGSVWMTHKKEAELMFADFNGTWTVFCRCGLLIVGKVAGRMT